MIKLRYFFRRLRTVAALVATLIFFLSVLLPPVLGLITRAIIINQIKAVPGDMLAEFHVNSLTVESVHAGWFSSEIVINASGPILSGDGRSSVTHTGVLHINHGPVIWHLSDSLLALAEMQLIPAANNTDPSQHFSGSAIARLTPSSRLQLDAIAGVNASGGEHWLELHLTAPLPPLPGNTQGTVWLDLDIEALNAAGLGPQIAQWQLKEHARMSNNRLLFYIGLH